jgi:hypothetical protein
MALRILMRLYFVSGMRRVMFPKIWLARRSGNTCAPDGSTIAGFLRGFQGKL